MRTVGRRRAMGFFITLGACSVALALALNITWVILNWRSLVLMVIGVPFFLLVIAGVVLNTIFLVREIHRNERHNSFLDAVTHELKTPIATIRLYLETLQRREMPESQRQEFYAVMHADSDRLLATVEQVLKAGEIGQRARNQIRLRVNFEEVVQEAIRTTSQRYHLPESVIEFERPESDGLSVQGNPEDLRTAVVNLLDNAVKYSPQGPEIRIRLSADDDAWIMLAVSDRGLGVPPADLKRIFKRFYRVPTRNVFKVKGTGLGLFLVRTIARQHGGDAIAESHGEGRGTTVYLQLPRVLAPAPNEEIGTEV